MAVMGQVTIVIRNGSAIAAFRDAVALLTEQIKGRPTKCELRRIKRLLARAAAGLEVRDGQTYSSR